MYTSQSQVAEKYRNVLRKKTKKQKIAHWYGDINILKMNDFNKQQKTVAVLYTMRKMNHNQKNM